MIRPALEARYPLRAAVVDSAAGAFPASRSGIALDRKGVLVTAFGANPDGPGTILRLWELTGQSGTCRVQLPDGMRPSLVQPVNLRGEPEGKPRPVRNGSLRYEVKGFAPASFVIPD